MVCLTKIHAGNSTMETMLEPGTGMVGKNSLDECASRSQHLWAELFSCFTTHCSHKVVMVAFQYLGQGQVKACCSFGAALHRGTKTGVAGLGAVDGQDKNLLAPGLVVGILVWAAQKDLVLNLDGLQLAGPHPEERIFGDGLGPGRYLEALGSFVGPKQP